MEEKEQSQNTFSNPKKKSTSKMMLIIVGIIILMAAIGVGIVYLVDQKVTDYETDQLTKSFEERESEKRNLFSVSEYDAIPDEYKEHIYYFLEYNGFLDGSYFLTKISDRAKKVYAFGDFTSDDNDYDDLAVIFESSDFKSSKLVIFNHKGELLFVEDYEYELPTINTFKVGSKIYMDEPKLVPAPTDGLILKSQYNKRAIVYNKKDKKFNTYHQYTKEEIDEIENDINYYEEEVQVATETEDSNNQLQPNSDEFIIQEIK